MTENHKKENMIMLSEKTFAPVIHMIYSAKQKAEYQVSLTS